MYSSISVLIIHNHLVTGDLCSKRSRQEGVAAIAEGQVPQQVGLPRRPPRLQADLLRRARHVHLSPLGNHPRRLTLPRIWRRTCYPPRLYTAGRGHRHALPPRRRPVAGRQQREEQGRWAPLRLQPPHPPRPDHRRRRPEQARDGGDVQRELDLGAARTHPHGAAYAGPGRGPQAHGGVAGAWRPRGVPRGHDMPRALPAPVQPSVRRARSTS